jgi:hypothetical protein
MRHWIDERERSRQYPNSVPRRSAVNAEPLTYAVILNWNRPEDTLECLETLAQQTYANLRLLVVDNGSSDDSVARIRAAFSTVEVIESSENLGFAGGMNLGLRRAVAAGAELVFVLNNDTLVDPGAVAQLVAHSRPGVGILAPLIYYADDPKRVWSAGAYFHPFTLELRGKAQGTIDHEQWREPIAKDFFTGCAMLLTQELLELVGFFDDKFFMYYEDADLCFRTRQARLGVELVPMAKIWHKISRSSGGSDSPNERYWMARSSVIYFRKHARPAQWLAILPWRTGSAIRTTIRLLSQGRVEACRAYWRGLRDGCRAQKT